LPVRAKVRAKPRVMAESSQVRYQKRQAMTIWERSAMMMRAREIKTAENGRYLEALERTVAGEIFSDAALTSDGTMQTLSLTYRALNALVMRAPMRYGFEEVIGAQVV
jgi:hypothetical protein